MKEALEQLLKLSAANVAANAVADGKPVVIVPDGYKPVDLEFMLPKPLRKRGSANFQEFGSWLRYVKEHRRETSPVFASLENGLTLHCVLDFHAAEPSWHEHTATYTAQLAPEWRRWVGVSGRTMNQTALAEFLERNSADVKKPTGASVLEIVENLTAKVDARFENKLAVTDGKTRVLYEEDVKVSGGNTLKSGQMDLPRSLVVALPVFRHEAPLETTWRLRVGVNNRQLGFTLELPDSETLMEAAAVAYLARVKDELGTQPLIGSFKRS